MLGPEGLIHVEQANIVVFTIAGMSGGKASQQEQQGLPFKNNGKVEMISSPQPGSSPNFIQEWMVQTVKSTDRRHFLVNSELTTLNGTTHLQTEGCAGFR